MAHAENLKDKYESYHAYQLSLNEPSHEQKTYNQFSPTMPKHNHEAYQIRLDDYQTP